MPQPELHAPLQRAGIEDRAEPRHRCRANKLLRFVIKPSFRNNVALVHDVSRNGIGFLINHPLEPGVTLAIQLTGGREVLTLVRLAEVMHVRRALPGANAAWFRKRPSLRNLMPFFLKGPIETHPPYVYLVGCKFRHTLSPEELELTCGPFLP